MIHNTKYNEKNMPLIEPKAPKQKKRTDDCGPYICLYASRVIEIYHNAKWKKKNLDLQLEIGIGLDQMKIDKQKSNAMRNQAILQQKIVSDKLQFGYMPLKAFLHQLSKKEYAPGPVSPDTDSCSHNNGLQILCDEFNCNQDDCQNRWGMKEPWGQMKCSPSPEEGMGKGLMAVCRIEAGTVIGPYTGKVRRKQTGSYVMRIGLNDVDAEKEGNFTRYINHCCDKKRANCELVKKETYGLEIAWVITRQVIKKNEFLSMHYGDKMKLHECLCTACRKK